MSIDRRLKFEQHIQNRAWAIKIVLQPPLRLNSSIDTEHKITWYRALWWSIIIYTLHATAIANRKKLHTKQNKSIRLIFKTSTKSGHPTSLQHTTKRPYGVHLWSGEDHFQEVYEKWKYNDQKHWYINVRKCMTYGAPAARAHTE